jgi:CRP-like cAMP-binding protein
MMLLVIIVYNCLYVPFELAFQKIDALTYVDYVSDAIFLIDIVVTFHTCVILEENGEEMIVSDRDIICRQYLYGSFMVDVISIGPPFGVFDAGVNAFGFLKFLKLVRIFRAVRILQKLITVSPDGEEMFRVLTMVILIVYAAHLLGCFFWMVGKARSSEGDCGGIALCSNWISSKELNEKDGATRYQQYIAAVYWAVMTITTVGYGDISAQNEYEMIFSSCIMVGGAIFYAVVLGSVTAAITTLSSSNRPYLQRVRVVDRFVKHYALPDELANRIKETTDFQWYLHHSFDSKAILDALPPELRTDVLMSIHRPLLIKVPFFQEVDEAFVKMVVNELTPHVCLKGDYIFQEGDDGDQMYLLTKGILERIECGCVVGCLEEGAFFGEVAVLDPELSRRTASVKAITNAVFHTLSREALFRCIAAFPHIRSILERTAMKMVRDTVKRRLEANDPSSEQHTVTIDVLQARNLASKDMTGFSDPYCKVRFLDPAAKRREEEERKGKEAAPAELLSSKHTKASNQFHHTKVVYKNINPKWNETFHFDFDGVPTDSDAVVEFTFWDKDALGSDDFMGEVCFHVKELSDKPVIDWYKLGKREGGEKNIKGDVYLRLFRHPKGGLGLSTKKVTELTSAQRKVSAIAVNGTLEVASAGNINSDLDRGRLEKIEAKLKKAEALEARVKTMESSLDKILKHLGA